MHWLCKKDGIVWIGYKNDVFGRINSIVREMDLVPQSAASCEAQKKKKRLVN